jgi:hypothetical protein
LNQLTDKIAFSYHNVAPLALVASCPPFCRGEYNSLS